MRVANDIRRRQQLCRVEPGIGNRRRIEAIAYAIVDRVVVDKDDLAIALVGSDRVVFLGRNIVEV